MERNCKRCSASFEIHKDEEAFLEKICFAYGSSMLRPPHPVYCPDCRCKIRTCYRNESKMYKVKSAFSGKEIISIYHEKSPQGLPVQIYAQDEWRSDSFDPMQYGRDFDFNRSFFEQFYELQMAVPRMALISIDNENSGFTTGTGYCKNCYLINSSEYCEDCYYGKLLQKCSDCIDCSYLYDSELCYECFSVYESYGCQYVSFSRNCTECFFSSCLQSCQNCCLCTNLVNKQYHFMNEPLSKNEYEKRLGDFRGNYVMTEKMKKLSSDAMRGMVRKFANTVNCVDCSGDYIENSKNCHDCYDVNDSEDCRYVQVGVNVKDNYDCSNMYLKPELCYETLGTIEVYNCAYCLFIFHSKNMLYCDYCFSCSDCFACSGLTRKQYCIFNKQYSKDEYDQLVVKIVTHMKSSDEWGLYFPPQYAPFGYNESLAFEYFPLEKEAAIAQGLLWRDPDPRDFKTQTCRFSEAIDSVDDTITQEVFACESCKKNYRIIPQELQFYRQQLVPPPRKCPDCRHGERMKLRNPRKLHLRSCDACKKEMESTYAPDRTEKILCEECYLKEVY